MKNIFNQFIIIIMYLSLPLIIFFIHLNIFYYFRFYYNILGLSIFMITNIL